MFILTTKTMKKRFRIKKTSEIDALFKTKKSIGNKYFGIHYNNVRDNDHFRFALSIGKKYGNAVQRNLIKRQIRSIIRENKNNIPLIDFVIVIRPKSNSLSFKEISDNILLLINKMKEKEDKEW